jgi:serine phosphatase RsbU (regulator of sigma subunit)
MTDPAPRPLIVDWAYAASALENNCSGDLHVVAPFDGGTLLAVIDGLGHGYEAALAAEAAASIMRDVANRAVDEIVARCHEGMRKTRGAVMTVVSIDARSSTLAWCGVGNVEGILMRPLQAESATEAVPARGGVVGYRIPPLKVNALPIGVGDLILLATDGIRGGFTRHVDPAGTPQEIANSVFIQDAKTSDDALLFVARYLGGSP